MLRFPLQRASFDAQDFLNESLGDEAEEPHPQADQQPHGAVLSGLGFLGQVEDDEHHVGNQPPEADLEGDVLELGNGEAEDQRLGGQGHSVQSPLWPRLARALAAAFAAMRMRRALRRMKPWASFWL